MPAACSLNLRVEVAQVGVSMDGKMLMTTFLPIKSARLTACNFASLRVNAGAGAPIVGKSPAVLTGLPRRSVLCHVEVLCVWLD